MPKQPETGRTAAIMRSSSTTRIRSRGRVELGRLALGCFALRRNLADVYCIGHSGGVAYKAPHSRERKRGNSVLVGEFVASALWENHAAWTRKASGIHRGRPTWVRSDPFDHLQKEGFETRPFTEPRDALQVLRIQTSDTC